jgi:hypothetical protein
MGYPVSPSMFIPRVSRGSNFYNFYRPVVATFSTFGMVKMPINQIVDVVAMRNRFMPASRCVLVPAGVTSAIVLGLD